MHRRSISPNLQASVLSRRAPRWVVAVALVFTCGSCAKGSGEAQAKDNAPAVASSPLPATAAGVIEGYERVRQLLASDQVAAAGPAAKALATAAEGAASDKSVPDAAVFERLAPAAVTLSTTDAKDPDAVRRQFGEVSRVFVELLAKNQSLRGSRLVFECPMAQGYRKWVQLTPTINNPYMGSKMLECGVASTWTP